MEGPNPYQVLDIKKASIPYVHINMWFLFACDPLQSLYCFFLVKISFDLDCAYKQSIAEPLSLFPG